MRSVRCEVCGAKALTAASTCPTCGHLFELRDGFGKLLPLAYCLTCDSYYLESLGRCRWCGTAPVPAPKVPRVWKVVGIIAVVGLTVGVWLAWRDTSTGVTPAPVVAKAQPDSKPVRADVVAPPVTLPPIDTPGARTMIVSAGSIAQESTRAPSTTRVESTRVDTTPKVAARPIVSSKPVPKPPAKVPATASSSTARTPTRWVNSISRGWAVVRADASKGSRVVASVGPNSRVQLGETRGAWRRIRAKGLAGWVEHRLFSAQ
ncbi:MAG TPA: SH3 domain-containing protein [Gemmatimonadaceae bacterium]|nr:SH3 domain-containing protein [Gemmatimonadaceae bacterium]